MKITTKCAETNVIYNYLTVGSFTIHGVSLAVPGGGFTDSDLTTSPFQTVYVFYINLRDIVTLTTAILREVKITLEEAGKKYLLRILWIKFAKYYFLSNFTCYSNLIF